MSMELHVGKVVQLTVDNPVPPREVRFHMGNCCEKQRRFVLSLGELLEMNKGEHFREVMAGREMIGCSPEGHAYALRISEVTKS